MTFLLIALPYRKGVAKPRPPAALTSQTHCLQGVNSEAPKSSPRMSQAPPRHFAPRKDASPERDGAECPSCRGLRVVWGKLSLVDQIVAGSSSVRAPSWRHDSSASVYSF